MSWLLCCLFIQGGFAGMMQPFHAPPGRYWTFDINRVENPYGIVELGYSRPIGKRWDFQFDLRHDSSIPANDQGQNTAEVALRWYPFR